MLTQLDYYAMKAALQQLGNQISTINSFMDQVVDIFNNIDPGQLPSSTVPPTGLVTQASGSHASTPPITGASPILPVKPRKKLNMPVIQGALGDVIQDMMEEKKVQEEAEKGPQRISPYEVEVTGVNIDPNGKYWATVKDKYNQIAMVPSTETVYKEYISDPEDLMVYLDQSILDNATWLPYDIPIDPVVAAMPETEI
jgi:hypothetical protein